MARHGAVFDFRRALVDADHLWISAALIRTPSVRLSTRAGLLEARDHLGTRLTGRYGVKNGLAGLLADL